jgi:hypothetical protein
MVPLIRWTVGPVSDAGFEILELSVANFIKIYPQFDFCICYNQIDLSKIKHLEKYGVSFYNQNDWKSSWGISPKGEIWKIYPPRLRQDSHEIIMDNDLIIFERIPEIDEFLESQKSIMLSGLFRFYGSFSNIIPKKYKLNSGLYGFPPGFDFENIIRILCAKKQKNNKWKQNRRKLLYDDQGVIAYAVTKYQKPIIISQNSIFNFNFKLKKIIPINAKGIHFIGSNVRQHPAWEKFKALKYNWSAFKRIYCGKLVL